MTVINDIWISIEEAAKILNRPKMQIYNHISKLPHTKLGRNYMLHKPSLEELIREDRLDEIIPEKAEWEKFTKFLEESIDDRITLTIQKIKSISGSSSRNLHKPEEWSFNANKGTSGAYKAMARGGYDIIEMKFGFSPEDRANVISEITFQKVNQEERINEKVLTEHREFDFTGCGNVIVRHNKPLRLGVIHSITCPMVKKYSEEITRNSEWVRHDTVKEAVAYCESNFDENWKFCNKCMK